MKKALKDIDESSSIAGEANDEYIEHLTQLLLDRKKQYDLLQSIKDKQDVIDLNKEIDNFNSVKTPNQPKISSFMNREKVLDELDELTGRIYTQSKMSFTRCRKLRKFSIH